MSDFVQGLAIAAVVVGGAQVPEVTRQPALVAPADDPLDEPHGLQEPGRLLTLPGLLDRALR